MAGFLRSLFGRRVSKRRSLASALDRSEGEGGGVLFRIGSEDGDRFLLIEDAAALSRLAGEPLVGMLLEQPEPPKFPTYTATLMRDRKRVAYFDLGKPPGFNFEAELAARLAAMDMPAIKVDDYSEYEVLGRAEFDTLTRRIAAEPAWFALDPPARVPSVFSQQMMLKLPAVDIEADTPGIRAEALERAEAAIRRAFPEDDLYAIDHIGLEPVHPPVFLRRSPPGTKGVQKTPTVALPARALLRPVAILSSEDAFVDYAVREVGTLIPQDAFWSDEFARTIASLARDTFGAEVEECCLGNGMLISAIAFASGQNWATVPHFRIAESAS